MRQAIGEQSHYVTHCHHCVGAWMSDLSYLQALSIAKDLKGCHSVLLQSRQSLKLVEELSAFNTILFVCANMFVFKAKRTAGARTFLNRLTIRVFTERFNFMFNLTLADHGKFIGIQISMEWRNGNGRLAGVINWQRKALDWVQKSPFVIKVLESEYQR